MILQSEARLIVCRKVAFYSECFFISRKKIILEVGSFKKSQHCIIDIEALEHKLIFDYYLCVQVQNVSLFMEVTFKDICCWSGMLMHHTTNSDYTCGEWGCLYLNLFFGKGSE